MTNFFADLLNAAAGGETVISIDDAATTLAESSWRRGVPLNRDAVAWLLGHGSAAPRPPADQPDEATWPDPAVMYAGCATVPAPGR